MAKAGADDGGYNPAAGIRGVVGHADKQEGGIGQGGEKNPVATLRIFGSNLGNQWLTYGTTGGGTQDYTPPPPGKDMGSCKWFWFYYTGLMVIDGDAFFGNWRVKAEGDGLEPVAHQVAKHTLPVMRVGEKSVNIHNPILIRAITIEPYKPKKMVIVGGKAVADDGEEEEE